MKKALRSLTVFTVIISVCVSCLCFNVAAAGASCSANKSSCKVGDSVTVSCTFTTNCSMYYFAGSVSGYSSAFGYVSGGGNESDNMVYVCPDMSGSNTYSFQLVFTAVSAGSATFTFSGSGSDGGDTEETYSDSCTVTVSNSSASSKSTVSQSGQTTANNTDTAEKSGEAYLTSLKVSGAELSPSFKSSTTNYTATVKNSVEKVTISANAVNGATFVGAGTFDVKEGDNKHTITVTAQNGKTKKSYTITVHRMTSAEEKTAEEESENPLEITIGKKKYTMVLDTTAYGTYENFVPNQIARGENEVTYIADSYGKYKLFYMIGEDGNGGYFNMVSDDVFKSVSCLAFKNRLYIVENIPENAVIPSKYKKTSFTSAFGEISALSLAGSSDNDIYVIYCYYDGKSEYYRYDTTEQILMRAPDLSFGKTATATDEGEKESLIGKYLNRFKSMSTEGKLLLLMLFLGALSVMALIVLIIIKTVKNNKRDIEGTEVDFPYENYSEEDEIPEGTDEVDAEDETITDITNEE